MIRESEVDRKIKSLIFILKVQRYHQKYNHILKNHHLDLDYKKFALIVILIKSPPKEKVVVIKKSK